MNASTHNAPATSLVAQLEQIVGAERRDIGARHRDPILPAEPPDQSFQHIGALCPAIQQRQADGREIVGDDQSRNATTAAQIENGLDRTIASLEGADEPAGVLDHLRDRS